MKRIVSSLILSASALVLAGCVANYQYLSRGEVATGEGDTRQAVLYWHKDEGRLWYGKSYEQLDSSVTLRICRQLPKLFDLNTAGYLVLRSKAGDIRIADVAEYGELRALDTGERLADGDRCGLIQAGGVEADTADLTVGTRPTVTILCENAVRPDRYPAVARYTFHAINRVETDESRSAPDPCVTLDGPLEMK